MSSRNTSLRSAVVSANVLAESCGSMSYFQPYSSIVGKLPYEVIDAVTDVFWDAYQRDQVLFVFGNGGSAALASHSACDFGKGNGGQWKPTIPRNVSDDNVPLMTAWANNQRYEDIFAEQLRTFVRSGDVVFAISGSGNSANVLNGLQVARDSGAQTVGLTGFKGGKMKVVIEVGRDTLRQHATDRGLPHCCDAFDLHDIEKTDV